MPLVLVVNNDLPVKSVADFIAYAKANPGKVSIASSGIGTSLHLSGELFKSMAAVEFTHVPYRGSAPGLTDVMSGQIQGMFDNVTSSFELVRAGKLRALGITTRERSEILPDVALDRRHAARPRDELVLRRRCPHDTPREDRQTCPIAVIDAALSDPAIKARIAELGGHPAAPAPPVSSAACRPTRPRRWRKVVELSGIRKE
ncbi:Bug family tripartite tricarboxylate transporter substrate binding protein [Bradyrhizobium betae]